MAEDFSKSISFQDNSHAPEEKPPSREKISEKAAGRPMTITIIYIIVVVVGAVNMWVSAKKAD
jgi:hypothetical protein